VFAVEAFVEKPNPEIAARYVAEGYLWNSGNFLFRADVLLAELARYEPAMAEAVESAVAGASNDLGFVRLAPVAFADAPQKSIDYAVMEKTTAPPSSPGNSAGPISAPGTRFSTLPSATNPAMPSTAPR